MVGVVLAGGAGRRMGRPKGELIHDGVTLARRAADLLRAHCERVVISVACGADNPAPGFAVVADAARENQGPLAGIDAAFRASGSADLLVLACDYPFASARLLGEIAAAKPGADLVFARDLNGRDHPLVALWRRSAAAAVSAALRDGRLTVSALCDTLRVERLGPGALREIDLARELLNWNRPEDLYPLG